MARESQEHREREERESVAESIRRLRETQPDQTSGVSGEWQSRMASDAAGAERPPNDPGHQPSGGAGQGLNDGMSNGLNAYKAFSGGGASGGGGAAGGLYGNAATVGGPAGGVYGSAATGGVASGGGIYGSAATGGVAGGGAAGGGAAGGSAAGGGLAAAGPWAALAAAIYTNESEARDGGYRSEDDGEYAQDLLQGKVLYQDVDQRWAPKIFGSDDSTGLGGDMRSAAAAGGLDFKKTWKHAKDDSTLAKAIKKIF